MQEGVCPPWEAQGCDMHETVPEATQTLNGRCDKKIQIVKDQYRLFLGIINETYFGVPGMATYISNKGLSKWLACRADTTYYIFPEPVRRLGTWTWILGKIGME